MNTSEVQKDVFLCERRFFLNPRKSKYVSICISCQLNYTPCVIISGNKNDMLVFSEKDWNDFVSNKEIINSLLVTSDSTDLIDIGRFCVEVKQLPHTSVVRMYTGDSSVRLSFKSVSKLWHLIPIIQYRLELLKHQGFSVVIILLRAGTKGNEIIETSLSLLETIKRLNPEMYTFGLEVIYNYPELLIEESNYEKSTIF
uniref:Uncharacterized protein LOC114337305 n=1 Tax=Diabrotica virgifera virgifera TaxID=50390 RepID=A0A6P7G3F6_DIAVI